MRRYTLEEVVSFDVDSPPKTLDKARRKFGPGGALQAYAWFYGEEALDRQLKKKNNGRVS